MDFIFVNPRDNYYNTKNYKWKPNNTIDLMAIRCPESLLGTKPYIETADTELYILMVSITFTNQEEIGLLPIEKYREILESAGLSNTSKNHVYPIQFSPSINPLAYLYWHKKSSPFILRDAPYKIVEMSVIMQDKSPEWKLLRIREDRQNEAGYFGNSFSIAEINYQSVYKPLDFKDLTSPKSGYFASVSPEIYKASNAYKRYVIESVFQNNLRNATWIVDLASGRGADLQRYKRMNVKNVLFVDIDVLAITELIARKYAKLREKFMPKYLGGSYHVSDKALTNTNVFVMIQDLTEPPKTILDAMTQYGISMKTVDAVVCNFALHYFCDTLIHLKQFITIVSSLVRVGGIFIFTVMNGEIIFEKCADTGNYILSENNAIKYAIYAQYYEINSKNKIKLANYGQFIKVKLPFSTEEITKPLCNVNYIINEFSKVGFNVELNNNFADKITQFEESNHNYAKKLTPNDKLYASLHTYVSLRKIR